MYVVTYVIKCIFLINQMYLKTDFQKAKIDVPAVCNMQQH